jgi:hypothetical protein
MTLETERDRFDLLLTDMVRVAPRTGLSGPLAVAASDGCTSGSGDTRSAVTA